MALICRITLAVLRFCMCSRTSFSLDPIWSASVANGRSTRGTSVCSNPSSLMSSGSVTVLIGLCRSDLFVAARDSLQALAVEDANLVATVGEDTMLREATQYARECFFRSADHLRQCGFADNHLDRLCRWGRQNKDVGRQPRGEFFYGA